MEKDETRAESQIHYFDGLIISGAALDEVAKEKAVDFHQIRVSNAELDSYLQKGWQVKRHLKRYSVLTKTKDKGELLEDEIWLIFKGMGFSELNKDRDFKIKIGNSWKQIDVFAKDDNNVFIIECKTGSSDLSKDIADLIVSKREITDSVKKRYGKNFRFAFLFVTKGVSWSRGDIELAKENKRNNLFYWQDNDIEAYKILVERIGEAAKFQMFSLLFGNRKALEIGKIEVPAIYGGKGKNKYYAFLIQPGKLLPIAYVNRREKSNPDEIRNTYQRMVKVGRIKEIHDFIETGGFFPNNIIISFTKKPKFEKKDVIGDVVYGILKFPPYYGCAWIIDGQHRLYGYAASNKKFEAMLPVVAFESLNVKDQANLFVEINEKQQSVSANLLWDLYPDIYEGSEDKSQKKLSAISLATKKLDTDNASALYHKIMIPSLSFGSNEKMSLSIANVCDAIYENNLFEQRFLYKEDYDSSIDFITKRLEAYLEVIADYLKEDWEAGSNGLTRTNVGIKILLIAFRQLLLYFNSKNEEQVYRSENLSRFKSETKEILLPFLNKIKELPSQKRTNIRGTSSKGPLIRNAQELLWGVKERHNFFGLELWRKGGWTPDIPTEKSESVIEKLIKDTEIKLRRFVIQTLKGAYGDNWWKVGLNGEVKKYIENEIEKDLAAHPWKRDELLNLTPDKKIDYTLIPQLRDIIVGGNNWARFEDTFGKDKDALIVSFKHYYILRNKMDHPRDITDVEKGLGYWHMIWLRRCIGLLDFADS